MKSTRVILLLFYLLSSNVYGFYVDDSYPDKNISLYKSIDSLFDSQNKRLSKSDALNVIAALESSKENEKENPTLLNNEEYKKLAISYARIGNETKTNEYINKYIQNTYDIKILDLNAFDTIRGSSGFKGLEEKYVPKINAWLIFFFATGLIGIFIAVVLNLRKQGDVIANILISVFVLVHSLFIIHIGLYFSKLDLALPHLLYASTSFSFLYGPLIYFYFKRISEKYVFKKSDFLHLIPTIILLIFLVPIYIKTSDEKLNLLYNRDNLLHNMLTAITVFKAISLSIYGYLIYNIQNKKESLNQYSEVKKWKRNMLLLNSAYVFSYVIYGVAIISMKTTGILIYFQVFFMSSIVLYVAYVAYVQPRVFSKKYLFDKLVFKYQKSGLTEKYSRELKEQLLLLLNKEKVFKINDLSLSSLSEIVGTSRHNLSQVINEHFEMNFFNLINKYRIEEALEIFMSDENRNLNIIEVAYDVGFNNKVTFNKAFKEITNFTPSQFLKNYKSKNLSIHINNY